MTLLEKVNYTLGYSYDSVGYCLKNIPKGRYRLDSNHKRFYYKVFKSVEEILNDDKSSFILRERNQDYFDVSQFNYLIIPHVAERDVGYIALVNESGDYYYLCVNGYSRHSGFHPNCDFDLKVDTDLHNYFVI